MIDPVIAAFSSIASNLLGAALLSAAWKGFALLAVVLGAARFIAIRSSETRHTWLWLGLVSLLLLPAFTASLPSLELAVLPASAPTAATAPSRARSPEGGTLAALFSGPGPHGAPGAPGDSRTGSALRHLSPEPGRTNWAFLLVTGWLTVTLLLLLRAVLGRRRVERLASDAVPASGPEWDSVTSRTSRRLGLKEGVPVLIARQKCVPLTFGSFQPRVILPAQAENWSEERRQAVLAHELAHARRNDVLIQVLSYLACTLYWFNPLAWLALRRIRQESERACDAAVLRLGITPSDYAHHLLEVAREFQPVSFRGVTAAMITETDLERRIRNVLSGRSGKGRSGQPVWAITTSLLALLVVGLAMLTLVPATVSAGTAASEPGYQESSIAPAPPPPPPPPAPPEGPPVPPPPPAPPPPALQGKLQWHEGDARISLDREGVTFRDDWTDVESIALGGYFIVTARTGSRVEQVELRPSPSGTIQRTYRVNDAEAPWGPEAESLLRQALQSLRELRAARAELIRVRDEELVRVREELEKVKEIDLSEVRQRLETAREELEKSREELRMQLSEETFASVTEAIENLKLEDFRLSEEEVRNINEELARIRETLPLQIEKELEQALQHLQELNLD